MADNSWFNALPQVPGTQAPPQMGGGGGGVPANVPVQAAPTAPKTNDWWDQLPKLETAVAPVPEPKAMTPATNMDWIYESPAEKASTVRQPQPLAAPGQPPARTWGNLGSALPSGLYNGIAKAANLPSDMVNGVSGVLGGLTGQNYGTLGRPFNENPMNYQPASPLATGIHDAASAASNTAALGGVAKAVAPLLPVGSGGRIAAEAIGQTPPSVIAAAGAGGAAEAPISERVPPEWRGLARIGTMVGVGGLATGLETAAGNAMRGGIDANTAQLAQMGRDTYDLPIRAGQISGNRIVRAADSVLQSIPGSGHAGIDEAGQLAFNRAVSKEMGEDATKITPSVMNAARTRIGGVLQNVEQNNTVNFDNPFVNHLAQIESDARSSLTDPEFGVIKRQLDGVLSNVRPGDDITGITYGNLMHKGSPLDAAANSANPNIASYASDIKEALRDSLQRSLSADDLAAYQQARSQWKVMRTAEPLTLRADIVGGASPATGDIIPAQLRGAVNKSYGNVAFADPGQVPLNDLANIGQRFLKETPTSQTSERTSVRKYLEGAGALGATLFGAEHGLGMPASELLPYIAGGVPATGLAARTASSVLRSDALANKMINRGLNPTAREAPVTAGGRAMVPLGASGVNQQMEAPSTNPTTGLPQFNLEDAQIDNKKLLANNIVSKLQDGSLAKPSDLATWISDNKRNLRMTLGGQGMQNISTVAALTRRPGTLFGLLANGSSADPEMRETLTKAGITDTASLAAHAILHPDFARVLAMPTKRTDLTKAGVARISEALSKTTEKTDVPDGWTSSAVGHGPRGGGDLGSNSARANLAPSVASVSLIERPHQGSTT